MIQSALYERPKWQRSSTAVRHKSCCRAIKTRATKRSIAFLVAEARPFDSGIFSVLGALSRGQRMLELWNNWYETLVSVEALATVVVIVVVAAGVITLAETRRR
jgi:nitrate reductase gamma subunit